MTRRSTVKNNSKYIFINKNGYLNREKHCQSGHQLQGFTPDNDNKMLNFKQSSMVILLTLTIFLLEIIPHNVLAMQCSQIFKINDNKNNEMKLADELNQLLLSIQNEKNISIQNSLRNKFYSLFNESKMKFGEARAIQIFQELNQQNTSPKYIQSRTNKNNNSVLDIVNSTVKVLPIDRGYLMIKSGKEFFYYSDTASTIPSYFLGMQKINDEVVRVISLRYNETVLMTKNGQFIFSSNSSKFKIESLQYPGNQIVHTYSLSTLKFSKSVLFIYDHGKVQFYTNKLPSYKSFFQEFERFNYDIIDAIAFGDMTYLIRKDGSLIRIDFKNKTIENLVLNYLDPHEKIIKTKTLHSNSKILIETNQGNLIIISVWVSKNPKPTNTSDKYLNLEVINNVISYKINHNMIAYQTRFNKVSIIFDMNQSVYQSHLSEHFSNKVQIVGLNDLYIIGKKDSDHYIFSRILKNNGNHQNGKIEVHHLNNIRKFYFNNSRLLVQKNDGSFHYLNEDDKLVPLDVDFKVTQVFPVYNRGFLLKSNENDFIFVENFVPDNLTSTKTYKIHIQRKNENIINFYISSDNVLIQYENGTIEKLLNYQQIGFRFNFESDEYNQSEYCLKDLNLINHHITDSVLREKK